MGYYRTQPLNSSPDGMSTMPVPLSSILLSDFFTAHVNIVADDTHYDNTHTQHDNTQQQQQQQYTSVPDAPISLSSVQTSLASVADLFSAFDTLYVLIACIATLMVCTIMDRRIRKCTT